MENFRRVLGFVKPQWRTIALSVVCAVLASALFALSIMSMLPLMKVIIEGEGLRGWAYSKMVSRRCGATFMETPLGSEGSDKLEIQKVREESSAKEAGLTPRDVLWDVQTEPKPSSSIRVGREELLTRLAQAQGTVWVTVQHYDEQRETLKLMLKDPFSYRLTKGPIEKLLSYLPPDQSGPDFKRNSIVLIVYVMLAATILRCLLRFFQEYLVRRVALRSIMQLRLAAYGNAIRLPLTHFAEHGTTDTMSRFVRDSNQINQGISTLFGKAVRIPITVVVLAVGAFSINAKMTGIVMLGAPLAAAVISKLGRKMKKATKRNLESWSKMLGRLQETLLGIRVVKGYHRETHEDEEFVKINFRLLKQQFRIAKINAAGGPLLEGLAICAACVAMVFAAGWIASNRMAGADFLTLAMVLAAMAESGRKLGNVWPRLQQADAAAGRVYTLVDTQAETDSPHAQALPALAHGLEFQNITFAYANTQEPALQDVNLKIRAGEIIAVVGPNGSGKTTLLSLIPRFFVPQQGCVLIDGVDVAQATLASLRGQIGLVTQQTVVFNDTIACNIAYGSDHASQEDIVAAAKKAYAHEFIEQTGQGYDTIIGQQGVTLSGGQLQRLAIARAILRDPAILIFDEAMSQIDADSEAKIQSAIGEFAHGRTSFIIAHRLSTIIDADRIVVLNGGRLEAQGTHQQLLQSCPLYKQLYETQFVE